MIEAKHAPLGRRGRLLTAEQIADDIFHGTRTAVWVRRKVARHRRIRLGHSTVRWWEYDVMEWLDDAREPG